MYFFSKESQQQLTSDTHRCGTCYLEAPAVGQEHIKPALTGWSQTPGLRVTAAQTDTYKTPPRGPDEAQSRS